MSNLFGVERGTQIYKMKLAMGITIGGDSDKSGNNTHLLLLMRMRLSEIFVLISLTNQTQFKKGNGQKLRMKVFLIIG